MLTLINLSQPPQNLTETHTLKPIPAQKPTTHPKLENSKPEVPITIIDKPAVTLQQINFNAADPLDAILAPTLTPPSEAAHITPEVAAQNPKRLQT
jgi:hypothetical protein